MLRASGNHDSPQPATATAMIELYAADVCPFAQRTRALLTHLRVQFRQHVVDLDARDPEFLKLTPTGRVPMLLDKRLRLYESTVINDYVAERYEFANAYDKDVATRARERLAMAMWDQAVVPAFYRSLGEPDSFDADARKQLTAHLQELIVTLHATGKRQGNLLSFHCAPFWARMTWLGSHSPVPGVVDEFIDLKGWLDGSVAQDAIQTTLPKRDDVVQRTLAKFASGRG